MNIQSVIEKGRKYSVNGNIYGFITDEADRPEWSKRLNAHLTGNGIDLKMEQRYRHNMAKAENPVFARFFDFVSENAGVAVDLASGPSGYFSPLLGRLSDEQALIVTDACTAVVNAHAAACTDPDFFVFDIDLDKPLPFVSGSITAFSGNLLNNIDNYRGLLCEIYRCLKPGGRFAAVEMFFDSGSKTAEYLKEHGAVWASFETLVGACKDIGFTFYGSEVIGTRKGRIADGDLFPLDDSDGSTDRTVYFTK